MAQGLQHGLGAGRPIGMGPQVSGQPAKVVRLVDVVPGCGPPHRQPDLATAFRHLAGNKRRTPGNVAEKISTGVTQHRRSRQPEGHKPSIEGGGHSDGALGSGREGGVQSRGQPCAEVARGLGQAQGLRCHTADLACRLRRREGDEAAGMSEGPRQGVVQKGLLQGARGSGAQGSGQPGLALTGPRPAGEDDQDVLRLRVLTAHHGAIRRHSSVPTIAKPALPP